MMVLVMVMVVRFLVQGLSTGDDGVTVADTNDNDNDDDIVMIVMVQ